MPGFDAEVNASGRGSHSVVVPRTILAELPSRRVQARIGDETFETTLGTYGGRTFLGLRKALLTALGVGAGDQIHVELEALAAVEEPEAEPDPVTCPELDAAVADDTPLREAWLQLPVGHREEYGRWVSGGAEAEVRSSRIGRLRHRLLG